MELNCIYDFILLLLCIYQLYKLFIWWLEYKSFELREKSIFALALFSPILNIFFSFLNDFKRKRQSIVYKIKIVGVARAVTIYIYAGIDEGRV